MRVVRSDAADRGVRRNSAVAESRITVAAVAVASIVTDAELTDPATSSTPADTVVVPEYVLLADSSSVPAPVLVSGAVTVWPIDEVTASVAAEFETSMMLDVPWRANGPMRVVVVLVPVYCNAPEVGSAHEEIARAQGVGSEIGNRKRAAVFDDIRGGITRATGIGDNNDGARACGPEFAAVSGDGTGERDGISGGHKDVSILPAPA